jgi:uncharacterized membrane protein YphA (DoxX/SURF4 family)
MSTGKLLPDREQKTAAHPDRYRAMRAGVILYGLASAASGITDFLWHDFDRAHQPIQAFGDNIPAVKLLAFITATIMIAGGLAILFKRSARAGAAALALIYFVFAIFWLPRFYTAPHFLGAHVPVFIGVLAGLAMELVAFAGAALVYSALEPASGTSNSSWPRTVLISRWIIGLSAIDFGLNHFAALHDVLIFVPKWMPFGPQFWAILTGICFVAAGLAILTKVKDVLASLLLAAMFLVFNFLALPQFIIADPKDHAAWGGNFFNLALVASIWLLADALYLRRREIQSQ